MKARWRAPTAGLLVALLLGACAAQPARQAAPQSAHTRATESATVAAPAAPATVEVEEDVGFTVTEAITMGGAARAAYREALQWLADGEHERGIELLLEVIEQEPEATGPHIDLGIAYGLAGRNEEAVTSLELAVAATPDHPVAHNELGIAYRRLGRFAEARASYQRALEIYPGYHYARRNLAVLCDLYLADTTCALDNYTLYQAAVSDDREVEIWVADLKIRAGVQ